VSFPHPCGSARPCSALPKIYARACSIWQGRAVSPVGSRVMGWIGPPVATMICLILL
jgi:hypothetical protein